MKEVFYTAIPPAIRRIAQPFKEICRCYECHDSQDLLNQLETYPLELFLIAQTSKDKLAGDSKSTAKEVVERYFLVGLFVPCKADIILYPMILFAGVSAGQYEKMKIAINDFQRDGKKAVKQKKSELAI